VRLRAPAEREHFYMEIPISLAHRRASLGKRATEIAKVIHKIQTPVSDLGPSPFCPTGKYSYLHGRKLIASTSA
jgi:hypothetical protein